jgi:hypothetical protein
MLLIVLNPTRGEGQEYALARAVSLSCEDEVVNLLTKKIRGIFRVIAIQIV